jgi:hypothetical protein
MQNSSSRNSNNDTNTNIYSNSNNYTYLNLRSLYKSLSNTQTQLVQSNEISTSCICPHLFKLSLPLGVVRAQQDYIVADTVHDIMSLVINNTVLENWEHKNKDFESISRKIESESSGTVSEIIGIKRDWAKGEGREIPPGFDDDVRDRFHGLLTGLAKRIMHKYERPKRALSEITITNIKNFHEGRIDAILEFDSGMYAAIDWKTYNLDPVNGSGGEKWQLLANLLLLNYRYTGSEDDWGKCLFGSIVYYNNAYVPRLPVKEDTIDRVKEGRNFSHEVLCGRSPPAKKPQFCPVCDTGASPSCDDCQFYREDSRLAYEGKHPPNYQLIRKTLFRKRYMVMEERAETHRQKFVIGIMMDKMGESAAIAELEKAGIVHTGYRVETKEKPGKEGKEDGNTPIHQNQYQNQNPTCVTLIRNGTNVFLQPRKQIRLIVKEHGIPLLACASASGGVKQVSGNRLVVDFRTKTMAKRAANILSIHDDSYTDKPSNIDTSNTSYNNRYNNHNNKHRNNDNNAENPPIGSIIIIPDEINLTKRLLEPLHKFHKLAADILIPYDDSEDSRNGGNSYAGIDSNNSNNNNSCSGKTGGRTWVGRGWTGRGSAQGTGGRTF